MTTLTQRRSSPPVTPQDEDVEKAVLGAILNDPDAYHEVSELLSSRAFHLPAHRHVWEAVTDLVARGTAVDVQTVTNHLRATGKLATVGGTAGLVDIADSSLSSANICSHAQILVDHQKRRELRQTLTEGVDQINGDPETLLETLQGRLLEIGEIGTGPLATTNEQIERMINSDIAVQSGQRGGLAWPIPDLTMATRGIRDGRIYLIIGLFKSGKSKLAIATIHHLIAQEKVPVLFLSLEMPARQVFHWLAGCALKINTEMYDSPRLSKPQMEQTHQWVLEHASNGQLQINDRPVQTPASICAAMRRAAIRQGVKVIFLDYLQKVVWSEGTPSVLDIARGLNLIAATAKRLSVAVIALSQVPKGVEKQSPQQLINLGDVKDAAAYAETADCALAITDPERHKEGSRPERDIKVLIEQRDGPTKILDVRADLRYGHFHALTSIEPEEAF